MGETLAPPKRAGRTTKKKERDESRDIGCNVQTRRELWIRLNRASLEWTQCRGRQNMPLSNVGTDYTWRGQVFGVGSQVIQADRRRSAGEGLTASPIDDLESLLRWIRVLCMRPSIDAPPRG